jgi:hypothetical protein
METDADSFKPLPDERTLFVIQILDSGSFFHSILPLTHVDVVHQPSSLLILGSFV